MLKYCQDVSSFQPQPSQTITDKQYCTTTKHPTKGSIVPRTNGGRLQFLMNLRFATIYVCQNHAITLPVATIKYNQYSFNVCSELAVVEDTFLTWATVLHILFRRQRYLKFSYSPIFTWDIVTLFFSQIQKTKNKPTKQPSSYTTLEFVFATGFIVCNLYLSGWMTVKCSDQENIHNSSLEFSDIELENYLGLTSHPMSIKI